MIFTPIYLEPPTPCKRPAALPIRHECKKIRYIEDKISDVSTVPSIPSIEGGCTFSDIMELDYLKVLLCVLSKYISKINIF